MTTRYPDGVQEPRQRGRPRVAEGCSQRMEPVMTRLPTPVYDQLVQRALGRGEPLSLVVRELLIMRLKS